MSKVPRGAITVLFCLLVAPFFRPQIIEHIGHPELYDLYFWWRVAASLAIVVLFLVVRCCKVFSAIAGLFALGALIPTLLFSGRLMVWFDQFFSFSMAMVLAAIATRLWRKEFLSALCFVTSVLLVCNCCSVIMFPDGIWAPHYYFFGNRNGIFLMMLPALGSSFMLDSERRGRLPIRSILLVAVSAINLMLDTSNTSSIALVLFLIAAFLVRYKVLRQFLNGITYVAAYLVAVLLFVLCRAGDVLKPVLEGVLREDVTFSGRTPVWDAVLGTQDPLSAFIGHGTVDYGYITIDGVTLNAHNLLLHIWYVGGALTMVLFFGLVAYAVASLYRGRVSKRVALAAAMLGAFFVVGITEAEPYCSFYFALGIAASIEPEAIRTRVVEAPPLSLRAE